MTVHHNYIRIKHH